MAGTLKGLLLVFGIFIGVHSGHWFGPSLNFQCHCLYGERCDLTTGECRLGCEMGYFGPACQYLSVAFLQSTEQVNSERGFPPDMAVDGYKSSCSISRLTYNPLWKVTFNEPTWIVWMDIIFPSNAEPVEVDVDVENAGIRHRCNASQTWLEPRQLRVVCKETYNATSVSIFATTSEQVRLELCEVLVYGGRNIALKKTATQSSEYVNPIYGADLAVDGNNSTYFNDRSCTHTSDTECPGGSQDPWWRLNLIDSYLLYRAVVFNNQGPNIGRLMDFRLKVGKGRTGPYSPIYRDRADPVQEVTSVLMPANQTAYRIEVRLRGECRILTLCEVQIYGDCLDMRYGLECNNTCSCRDPGEVCYKIDGRCLSGCLDGITGIDCKDVCPRRTFGRNCSRRCSVNCAAGLCNNVDGSCSCVPGWKGNNCTTVCDTGTYGDGCSERCDNCRDSSCHHVNGTCLLGCGRGWMGARCEAECNQTMFGWSCNESCSLSCVRQQCDGVTGACLECPEGFRGDQCQDEDDTSTVTMAVVAVVVLLLIAIAAAVIFVVVRRRRRRGPPPDVVPLKDTAAYDNGNDKVIVYENVTVPKHNTDNDSDVTEDLNDHVDITMDTDLDDNNLTLDRAKLIIDDSLRQTEEVPEEETEETHVLDVADLPSHMISWREDSQGLLEEFKSLPRDLQDDIPHTAGMREENRKKNRYKNICAYDHSRVKLAPKDGEPGSDYINANYIKGYTNQEVFIASQGPTKKMMEDFIRMLLELNAAIVVMLTNVVEDGKRKCEQYWDDADEFDIGDYTVDVIDVKEYAYYTVRTLQISEIGEPDFLRVTQYHFTAWPDKSVPTSPWSLINFRNKIMTPDRQKGPVVVHCSAGVGRTGTFIGLDYLMRMAEEVGHVDIYDCVERMRKARVNMVQTLDQYILLHEAMALTVHLPPITDSNTFLSNHVIDDATMTSEFMKLNLFVGQDAIYLHTCDLKTSESMMSLVDETASHASLGDGFGFDGSVFVPSYRHYREYLLMDTPDEASARDFYKWMFDLDIRTMVTLDLLNPNLWPEEGSTLKFSGSSITCTGVKVEGVTVIRTLSYEAQGIKLEFSQLTCPDWVDSTNLCDNPQILLDFIRRVRQTTSHRPVVVQSSPSYGNGGIFCCVANILEELEEEQKVAVPHIISQVRACKMEVIRGLAEYKLCYDCVRRYLETEHVYTNYNNPTSRS